MQIFCINEFKVEFEKLISKKQYSSLEEDIINYFFYKKTNELLSGTRLNNSNETPYIKKRLRGKGGFRLYFLVIVKNENLYLMFVHPKTGPFGVSSITDESKAFLYKQILAAIKNNKLYILNLDESEKHLVFLKT